MSGIATERSPATPLHGEGKGKRALITGLRGFTGRYLAQELSNAGYRVFGTVLPNEEPGPDLFQVDLCDRDAVAAMVAQVQPDVVAHLAAISFVGHANIEQIYRVNVVGTRNLLEALAAQSHRPACVLLASSGNIYGNASSGMLDELVAPMPTNDYAVSKLAMEYMARLWQDKLPIVIVRPFNYTGVGQEENFLLPKIVAHFRKAAPEIELGNLAIARDFSDVRMVARCYRRLLHASPAGQTFNVCSGTAHSLASVIGTMASIAGYQITVHSNPAFMRKDDVITLVGNNAKLSGVIGEIAITPLADTLRWMYEA
ncbi:MAG TPA: GDP-mannose 4,6-dehydratase [Telluria sp.]|jgi:nucleoside-diphosphate-sugar epimerase